MNSLKSIAHLCASYELLMFLSISSLEVASVISGADTQLFLSAPGGRQEKPFLQNVPSPQLVQPSLGVSHSATAAPGSAPNARANRATVRTTLRISHHLLLTERGRTTERD